MGLDEGNQDYSPCKHVFYARKLKNDQCPNFPITSRTLLAIVNFLMTDIIQFQ